MKNFQERLELAESIHGNDNFVEHIKKMYEDAKKEMPWYKRILIKAFEKIIDALISALVKRIINQKM